MTGVPRRRWASLRGRVQLLALGLALLSTVAALVAVVAIVRFADARTTNQRVTLALIDAQELQTGYIDQETALRGYALTGEATFLDPYERGRGLVAGAAVRLRADLRGREEATALLDAVIAAAGAWEATYVTPTLRPPAGVEPASPAFQTRGRAAFDRFRGAYEDLVSALRDERTFALVRADSAFEVVEVALAVLFAVLLVTSSILWHALRRWVLEPLDRVAADVRTVAGGNLRHPVAAAGPDEIVLVARDVDAMRASLVQALEESQAAHAHAAALADELVRSNQDLEQFAYVASHDLQEPLRKVASFCQLLDSRYGEELDERGRTYVAYAVDGAHRMQALINDLLAFSRVGRSAERFTPVALGPIVARAAELAADGADDVSIELPPALPTVPGDAALLEALFVNIVGNAVKFRGEEPPQVRVEVEPAGEGASWQFSVTDNGIGIADRHAERIFVIFQRLHSRADYAGTGIGLAVCKRIVEFHGGHLWLDTGYREGSRFCWTLPAEPNAERKPRR